MNEQKKTNGWFIYFELYDWKIYLYKLFSGWTGSWKPCRQWSRWDRCSVDILYIKHQVFLCDQSLLQGADQGDWDMLEGNMLRFCRTGWADFRSWRWGSKVARFASLEQERKNKFTVQMMCAPCTVCRMWIPKRLTILRNLNNNMEFDQVCLFLSFSSCGFYLLINFYFLFILGENPRPVQTIYTYTVWHCCLPVSKDADREHHASVMRRKAEAPKLRSNMGIATELLAKLVLYIRRQTQRKSTAARSFR